jgi:hypothetical protein
MIYFITFIFTLLLTHIARAVPACGDVAFPEDMYEPTYDDEQLVLAIYNATMNTKYDNMNGITNILACSHLATLYPRFVNIPNFPYIGGAFDIQGHNSPNCGKCWRLTNRATDVYINFAAIDAAMSGFVLSEHAYNALGGGIGPLELVVDQLLPHFCGFRSIN